MLSRAVKKPGGGFRLYDDLKEIRVLDTFRFYMTSKLPNPHYKAEVTTKVTLVNFTVKEKGLEEQLNSVVIRKMEAQLENNKNELIKNKSDNEEIMKRLDDDILKILATTKGNLIDDADIIGYLQQSK
jgi:dynein heavy chain